MIWNFKSRTKKSIQICNFRLRLEPNLWQTHFDTKFYKVSLGEIIVNRNIHSFRFLKVDLSEFIVRNGWGMHKLNKISIYYVVDESEIPLYSFRFFSRDKMFSVINLCEFQCSYGKRSIHNGIQSKKELRSWYLFYVAAENLSPIIGPMENIFVLGLVQSRLTIFAGILLFKTIHPWI